jgi:nucleoid-associated protein YgaU
VATASPLDWPGLAAPLPSPAIALVSPPSRRLSASRDELVVRPGDSLWSLTARRLGPGTTSTQIAATWPRLYAANRAAIGDNPDLIHPGQRLVPPAPDERTP